MTKDSTKFNMGGKDQNFVSGIFEVSLNWVKTEQFHGSVFECLLSIFDILSMQVVFFFFFFFVFCFHF